MATCDRTKIFDRYEILAETIFNDSYWYNAVLMLTGLVTAKH